MIKKLLPAFFLLTFSTLVGAAQPNPEKSVANAREQFFDIKNRSIELERMKREAYKRPVSENFALNFPAIKEDFEKIQKINTDVFQLATVKTPVNFAAVSKLVSEINRRAVRLKSNLFSADPETEKEAKNTPESFDPQDIKTLLEVLDKSVNSFAHNPIFQNINLVNPEDSLKAQKDLETAIKVSFAIREKAKKFAWK